MTKLEIYDPAMCCSTGVCGPEADPVLVAFAADLKWAGDRGVAVQRYNLSQEPQAFAANPAVVREMEASMDRLPIIAIDGRIVSTGVYLSRDQLAAKLGLTAAEKAGDGSTPLLVQARLLRLRRRSWRCPRSQPATFFSPAREGWAKPRSPAPQGLLWRRPASRC